MIRSEVGPPRGILNAGLGADKFHLTRKAPGPALEAWILHFWTVEWDLRGQEPYVSETLPHPSIHIVLEQGRSEVVGVMTGRFSRTLKDQGRVFGIKWRPGAFRSCVDFPVSQLTDVTVPLSRIFGADSDQLERDVMRLVDIDAMTAAAEAFLSGRLREPDSNMFLINKATDLILSGRDIQRVDQITKRLGIGKRTLQRVFQEYVGVSPKWVIKRARLHEAAERLHAEADVSIVDLALELGYFDQAHFIKDFKEIVGRSPLEYAKRRTGGPV